MLGTKKYTVTEFLQAIFLIMSADPEGCFIKITAKNVLQDESHSDRARYILTG